MPSVFTRILAGEIPGTFVYRDDLCAAFLTINPITNGHLLLCPVEEVDKWTDLEPSVSSHLFSTARLLARALEQAFACERVGLIIAGFEVPHCHLHLIPTASMEDLSFANAAGHVERNNLEAHARAIRSAMVDQGLSPHE